jgi:hypothetical protein
VPLFRLSLSCLICQQATSQILCRGGNRHDRRDPGRYLRRGRLLVLAVILRLRRRGEIIHRGYQRVGQQDGADAWISIGYLLAAK